VTGHWSPCLAFDDPLHLRAHRFLVEEAALLDARRFDLWLDVLADDIHYVMPVSVTRMGGDGAQRPAMAHLDEDRRSLAMRVERLTGGHAWTEDPPSRTRHLVTNVRTFAVETPGDVSVESSLLLFRSRGDDRPADLVCAGRRDVLRDVDGSLRLAKREITVDEAVLRTQNLAIFL
jgi:3-phenylpropionate/cinnamic acid dioxygenase small subunit